VLDSYALLAYLNRETGYKKVRKLLAEVQNTGDVLWMNEINIGESFYILLRKRGDEKANYFLETILPGLPIAAVSNHFDNVIEAAKIKAKHPLSFADCFAVATALSKDAAIVTGDPEFRSVEKIINIEWL
jgi:ribonuclease VapC